MENKVRNTKKIEEERKCLEIVPKNVLQDKPRQTPTSLTQKRSLSSGAVMSSIKYRQQERNWRFAFKCTRTFKC